MTEADAGADDTSGFCATAWLRSCPARAGSSGSDIPGAIPAASTGALVADGENGWLGLLLPEAHGGSSLGFAEASVLFEELGRGLIPEPVAATAVLGGRVLAHCLESDLAGPAGRRAGGAGGQVAVRDRER